MTQRRTVQLTGADCLQFKFQKTNRNTQVLDSLSTVSGGLFATWCRTVGRQTPRKRTRTNMFWTLCSRQWRTVRGRLPDYPPVKEQKSNSETAALDLLSPDPRTVRGYTADYPRIAQKQKQSAPKIATSLRSTNLWPNLHQLP
jgi:hypothetical protein